MNEKSLEVFQRAAAIRQQYLNEIEKLYDEVDAITISKEDILENLDYWASFLFKDRGKTIRIEHLSDEIYLEAFRALIENLVQLQTLKEIREIAGIGGK